GSRPVPGLDRRPHRVRHDGSLRRADPRRQTPRGRLTRHPRPGRRGAHPGRRGPRPARARAGGGSVVLGAARRRGARDARGLRPRRRAGGLPAHRAGPRAHPARPDRAAGRGARGGDRLRPLRLSPDSLAGGAPPSPPPRSSGVPMPLTVKALQKTGPDQPFRVTTIERRDPRPGDVVIDIAAAGICHSDIHTIRNEWGEAHFPLTVGHEIAGVVSAVGADVTDWEVGDRVGVGCMVNSCGTCLECRAGQEQNCLEGNVGTYNAIDVDGTVTQGGYAEKVVVDQRFVLRIPDEIAFDEAAPLLCAGITTYAPLRRWGAGEQVDGRAEKVAVLGL